MTSIRQLKRVLTGVPGLDLVLGGGLFETGVYIIQGGAGAGKTILANQICFSHAAHQRRAVYYTLLTESHDRLLEFLQPLSFFDATRLVSGINFVSGFKVLELEGLAGVVRSIRDVVSRERPELLVIDGVVSVEETTPNDIAYKKFLHEVQTITGMFRCTVLLLTNSDASRRLHAEQTMVDGIIELRAEVVRGKPRRSLEVLKMRGADQMRGIHSVAITKGGIVVRPRIEALLQAQGDRERPARHDRRGFGIEALDAILGGGVTAISNTMLFGPSGAGKTILGMHFLDAGLALGERALLFTFYERPEELLAKARRFGMASLARGIEEGQVKVIWQSSVESNIDEIGSELLDGFCSVRPGRIFLDGMHGFQATVDPPERIQDFFAAMADYFMSEGATFMFSAETEDLLGEPLRPPFPNASRLCHNIVLLRYAELRGRLARLITVLKMRDSGFDPSLRELRIEDNGVAVGPALAEAEMLISGQPRHVPE